MAKILEKIRNILGEAFLLIYGFLALEDDDDYEEEGLDCSDYQRKG